MDKFTEKTLSSKTVYNGRIFDITYDEIELADGLKRHREIIHHPGGVVIFAQKEDGNVLLVKQYRYATKSLQIELPAGRLEKGEDPLLAAKRELREETGYIAQNWKSLGYIFTTFGICDEKLYLFEAKDLTFDCQNPDEGEIIDYFELPLNEVRNLIKNGTINDAKTICTIARAKLI
jgi:ADP-ribose pyrophosphatase